MKLSDIKPGMIIEYRGRVYGHGNLIGRDKTRTGTVTQVTPNLIAVQGQRYPDTILVNDLLSGQVKITNLKGEGKMARPKREAPPKAKLLALFEEHEGKIEPIRKELNCTWLAAKRWLVEAEIIDSLGQPTSGYDFKWFGGTKKKKQTPTPEPEQAANQEPDEGEGESATEIIPEPYRKCEDCGKGLTCEEVREFNPAGYVNEETKILCSWCFFNNIARMPIGCSLPLEDSTEPQGEVMAKSDTGEEEAGEYIPWNIAKDYGWPPNNAVEKIMLEEVINAQFAVRRVLNNSVALALMKQVLGSGVV